TRFAFLCEHQTLALKSREVIRVLIPEFVLHQSLRRCVPSVVAKHLVHDREERGLPVRSRSYGDEANLLTRVAGNAIAESSPNVSHQFPVASHNLLEKGFELRTI